MNYCIAPFTSPSITPDGFKICSMPGQKVYPDISFWNSDEVIKIREQIIAGEIPESCKACRSMRDGLIVSKEKPTDTHVDLNFKALYIARSNKCEYACEMCSSSISHSYDKKYNDGKLGIIENDFDVIPYLHETQAVAISGGNPVIDKKVAEILENLDPDVVERFIITSNGTVFPDRFLNAIKRLKCDATLIFSMDGPKEFNEVVRSGAKQERIYRTINRVLDEIEDYPNLHVAIEYTFTNKSIHHYVDLYDEMLFEINPKHLKNNSVKVIANMCTYPHHLSVTTVPKSVIDDILFNQLPYLRQQPSPLSNQFKLGYDKFLNQYHNSVIM
ncbi:hypothetical protein COHAPHLL_00319 [Vibrio phage V09]|uniref:Radical SAM core domain-containing protein n=1 Tax=Vibrio phage V09 TaxID=2724327 RepID=A0A6H0XA52_9CAUD|nr:hypothetical protein COHAPHLL_00319 [Vibrio phage V09]